MRIGRSLLAAVCAFSMTAAVAADPKPADKSKCSAEPWQELTVSPRAIETPLMKYRLLPAEYELRDGNAAPILDRLPWERTQYFAEVVPKFGEYLDVPLNSPKLRGQEIFTFFPALRRAAYRKTADWQYPIGEEPLGDILLPDVQGARSIVGYGLSVWIRQRLAQGDLARAREGILVGLAVSRHYGRTPFVITQLVCSAVDSVLLSRVAELLSQPDSPNLYWALTQLPRPLIDLRPSIELEQRFLQMTIPGLDDLSQLKTATDWNRRALAVIHYFRETDNSARSEPGGNARVYEHVVQLARAELPAWTEGGAQRVAAMSDGEAALRWMIDVYDDLAGEMTGLASLDPPLAIPRLVPLQKRFTEFHASLGGPKSFLAATSVNSYINSHKIDRHIDALRVVEAIRNYAAGHRSQLPESLGKITEVPVPNDPFTGKPFHYEVKGGVATLSAEGIHRTDPDRDLACIKYHIRIRN
jgi:hypothetical protein